MQEIIDFIKNRRLKDVIQIGFVDIINNKAQVIPEPDAFYLDFGDAFLEILKMNDTVSGLKIHLSLMDVIDLSYLNSEDEDLMPYELSIDTLILANPESRDKNIISSIDLYGEERNSKGVMCDALSLHLESGQEIFFDPSFLYGICVGGAFQREYWSQKGFIDYDPLTKKTIYKV